MQDLSFFDTNILLYADDARFPEKQQKAANLFAEHLDNGSAVVSLQVLQEYFVAAVQKLKMPAQSAETKVGLIAKSQVVRIGTDDVISAIELHRLHQISFWDALIVHAARLSGASVVFSEDLQNNTRKTGTSWPPMIRRYLAALVVPFALLNHARKTGTSWPPISGLVWRHSSCPLRYKLA